LTLEEKISGLKQQLAQELQKKDSDNEIILSLSHEIAKLDTKLIRFSVDAGIINRLGKELVGRIETAVSELVKNAYDADATEVKLMFENAWNKGGTLYIDDDGIGMSYDELISGFMRLSSTEKIHHPISLRYKRKRAGKKGIGRFATQRLGEKLTIITQTEKSEQALKVEIDWNNFISDKELFFISNIIEFIPKEKKEGTTLIIEPLREAWTDGMIKRAFRYTSELLQPFPLSDKRKVDEEDRVDPGFQSTYYRKDGETFEKIIDDEEAFLNHALAEIEGYIMDDGQGCWALESDKLNFPREIYLIGKERDNEKSKFDIIRNVHFKCYYFIYSQDLLPPKTLSFIKGVGNERGGIRLYRNGFRVLPYGEKGDDWIGLDESSRRNTIIVSHQNSSFFGFAEVTDETGELYDETSSREGLIKNEAFNELTNFIYRSITSAVIKVAELRNRKATAAQKDWEKKETKTSEEIVDKAISDIEGLVLGADKDIDKKQQENYSQQGPNSNELIGAIIKLKEGRDQEKKERTKMIEETNMLRVLAGLGLVIGEFVHEIRRFLPAFDTDIKFLKRIVKDVAGAFERTERLDENLKGFTTYTSYFYKSISQNVLRELEPIELRDVVYDFEKVIYDDVKSSGFLFHTPIFEDYDLWTVPMHKSEWASILFNFYTNSKKAIRRAGSKGEIFIKCGRENEMIFLEFSDNGDGIKPENEDIIFNAFFTTTSAAGHNISDDDSIIGIGLGLKIVKDIIQSYGGDIFVTSPEKGYNTTLRIEIPKNEDD